ncbi:hypothetical protein [Microbulbifer sp. 2205BS26-8]|uniref:hypothetical protein n=1 Tax=Microbulbifer sp. 2205BS26-8 TaxID=3064386 RepID=UPI0035309D59
MEHAEAVFSDTQLEKLILSSDAIMVGRGDLAVEIRSAEQYLILWRAIFSVQIKRSRCA